MSDNRGAVWRKWDLHIHTPASFHWNAGPTYRAPDAQDEATAAVARAIIESEVAAFGVMDYWTFDGYFRLIEYLQRNGHNDTKLVLPGMELRVESPVEHRLHIHALLSNQLTRTRLEEFRSRLRIRTIERPPSEDALMAFARTLADDKARVHGFNAPVSSLSDDDLYRLGCMTAEITRDSLEEAKRLLAGACLIVQPFDTYGGLADLNWAEHPASAAFFLSFPDIFEVRGRRTFDLFLGRETPDNARYLADFRKTLGRHSKPVVSGSDAHSPAEYGLFPADKITWLKCNLTFDGLKQVVNEPRLRSYVGPRPRKLRRIDQNPTKFIAGIEIRREPDSNIAEQWFDHTLELSPDLVLRIGSSVTYS